MKFTRKMKLNKSEILDILERGEISFVKNSCWSGDNASKNTWFEVDDKHGDYEIIFFLDSDEEFARPTEIEKKSTAYDWQDTDEWRNTSELKLKIEECEYIDKEDVEEWIDYNLEDMGYIELNLK